MAEREGFSCPFNILKYNYKNNSVTISPTPSPTLFSDADGHLLVHFEPGFGQLSTITTAIAGGLPSTLSSKEWPSIERQWQMAGKPLVSRMACRSIPRRFRSTHRQLTNKIRSLSHGFLLPLGRTEGPVMEWQRQLLSSRASHASRVSRQARAISLCGAMS